jgi:DNA-directed RNA polymerase beta subunit
VREAVSVTHGVRQRRSFAKIPEILDVPNLIDIQKKSYEWFRTEGLREVFEDIPPSRITPGTWRWSSGSTSGRSPSTKWTSARKRI